MRPLDAEFCVVGLGSAGRRMVEILRSEGARRIVVVDPADVATPEGATRAAEPAGDILFWCAPVSTRREMVSHLGDFAAAYVEKPALDLGMDAPTLFNASKVRVGYQWRFHPVVPVLRYFASQGFGFSVRSHSRMREWPGSNYGHVLLEYSHELDLLRWICGPGIVNGASQHGNLWMTWIQHDDGAKSLFMADSDSEYRRSWMGMNGNDSLVWSTTHPDDPGVPTASRWRFVDTYREAVRDFLGMAIDGRASLLPTLDEAVEVVRWCDQAIEFDKVTR